MRHIYSSVIGSGPALGPSRRNVPRSFTFSAREPFARIEDPREPPLTGACTPLSLRTSWRPTGRAVLGVFLDQNAPGRFALRKTPRGATSGNRLPVRLSTERSRPPADQKAEAAGRRERHRTRTCGHPSPICHPGRRSPTTDHSRRHDTVEPDRTLATDTMINSNQTPDGFRRDRTRSTRQRHGRRVLRPHQRTKRRAR